jgi:hypothetical protein
MVRWQQLVYCARCNEVTDPESGRSVPAVLIHALLGPPTQSGSGD